MSGSAVMTFNSLAAEISGWLERETDSKLLENIPAIIADAESMLGRALKPLGFQTVYSSTVSKNNPVLSKPVRWRETVSLTLSVPQVITKETGITMSAPPYRNTKVLLPRALETVQRLLEANPVGDPFTLPLYYADLNWTHWTIAPVPAEAYPIQMVVWERPLPLSLQAQQNWLTINAPDLLRSACMARASLYIKNTATAEAWRGEYTRAFGDLTAEDKRRLADRAVNPPGNT